MQHSQERGKLTQSETQQQDFFNQSPDLLCIIQPDGTFGQLNLAWKRLLDWTPEALQSHPWIELVHPEDVEAALSAMLQAGDGEVSFVDNRYRHNDGSYRSLSWSLHKSEDGYWYAIAREIKANQQAKIALKSQVEAVPSKTEANKWSIEKKTVMLLGLASVILVSLNLLFFWSFIRQKETTERVAHSRLILQKIEAVLSSANDAETGQRGYLLTGRESYLKPYNLAIKTIEPQLKELKTLIGADTDQHQQLTRLQPLIEQKLAELKVTIDLKKS